MCKIVTFTNAKKLDITSTVNKVGNILLKTERDGFGYAAQGSKGVFGEKCIDSTFNSRIKKENKVPDNIIKPKYQLFGQYSDPVGGLILHGRISTNATGLLNCHPMIKNNHYLIHNGVVSDHGPDYVKATTNDSEDVLERFINGISEVEKHLTGYYAFSCFDDKNNLHVVRDKIATLNIAWCSKFQTYIIATTKHLLEDVAEAIKAKIGPIDEILEDIHLIFNNNEIVSRNPIVSRGYSYVEAKHASKSLGRELDEYDDYNNEYEDNIYMFDEYEDSYAAEDAFKDAIRMVDDRCIIFDKDNCEISSDDFHKLSFKQQKLCYIETPDGDCIYFYENTQKKIA